MKNEDGGEEAKDVADAEQRVGQGEIVVAKDVEPKQGGGAHGNPRGRELPVEKGAAEEGPRPGEGEHFGEGKLEEGLSGDKEDGLEGRENE